MSVSKPQVLDELRRIKGPDLEGNIVDLGLVSEILVKDDRVYFSITVPAARAEELEPLRKAAETVVGKVPGVSGVTAVLTAEAARGATGRRIGTSAGEPARGAGTGEGRHGQRLARTCARSRPRHGHSHAAPPAAAQPGTGPKPMAEVPGSKR